MTDLTQHARTRAAQRAVPHHAIDLVLDYGAVRRVNGADSYFIDRDARRRLYRDLGHDGWRRVERHTRIYVVLGDDGRVITVAHTYRRCRNR